MANRSVICFGSSRVGLDRKNEVILCFGTYEVYTKDICTKVTIDGISADFSTKVVDSSSARNMYKSENEGFNCEYQVKVIVPEIFNNIKITFLFGEKHNNFSKKYVIKRKDIEFIDEKIAHHIDRVAFFGQKAEISGWCVDSMPVNIEVFSEGKPVECSITRKARNDIDDYLVEAGNITEPGFSIVFDRAEYSDVLLRLTSADSIEEITVPMKEFSAGRKQGLKLIKAGMSYLKKNGILATCSKVKTRINNDKATRYDKWISGREPISEELEEQKKVQFEYNPLISIVVPVFCPVPDYFKDMIDSVLAQTYGNWELCLADGSGEGNYVDSYMQKKFADDARIKYMRLEENLGISGNTNMALGMATGDYIALGDHDDIIRPNALFEFVKALNDNPDIDFIYSDEDKYESKTRRRVGPHFKPDFNLDLLRSNNYICHLTMFSRTLYEECGGFRSEYDGAQDYDLILRYTEKANHISHIPKVLYSWRIHDQSTAASSITKDYVITAGRNALIDHFKRAGITAKVTDSSNACIYDVEYGLTQTPLVSIIIPNKDHTDDLDICLKSIVEKQDYDNYEIIVVENNSEESKTFEYYDELVKRYDKVRVIYYEGDFNYSRINNFGAKEAKGEYYLLLNNDTEMIDEKCLSSLVSFGIREDVGIVGAKLLYSDNSIQHAGVVIGMGGVAGHIFAGASSKLPIYYAHNLIPMEYSAVTAACLLVKKSVYEEVHGLEEELKVAYNDVDFCLKVREKKYKVVYNPYAVLYHYESKSRGQDDTPEKKERFRRESRYMVDKWAEYYDKGDPFYNVNLTLLSTECDLRGKYEYKVLDRIRMD